MSNKFPFHPAAAHKRLLAKDDPKFKEMVESIREGKQELPIYIWRGFIIDGRNRYNACLEAGVKPMFEDKTDVKEEELAELIYRLNDVRRHDTPEDQKAARQARVERIAKKRQQGKSARVIAGEEGVSESQVRRDLSGAPGGAPEPEGGKVKGKDGKNYRTSGKSNSKKNGVNHAETNGSTAYPSAVEPEEPEETENVPPPPTDAVGLPLPPEAVESFALGEKFDEALRLHRQLSALVDEIAKAPGGEDFQKVCQLKERDGKQSFQIDSLHNLAYIFKERRPHSSRCPWCHAEGHPKNRKSCEACNGRPYVSKWKWDSCNQDYRQAVEELAQ